MVDVAGDEFRGVEGGWSWRRGKVLLGKVCLVTCDDFLGNSGHLSRTIITDAIIMIRVRNSSSGGKGFN